MISRTRALVLALTILAIWAFVVPTQALAGIIVTEGKISYCGVRLINIQKMITLGLWHDDGACHDSNREDADSEDEDTGDDYSDDDDLDIDDEDLGDLDVTPDGYDCDELAGGIEYCEPEPSGEDGDDEDEEGASDDSDGDDQDEGGEGAGPGAARGGTWVQGAATNDEVLASDEEQVAGCQAGGSAGDSLPAALVVCFALVAVLRRRFTV
jgi:hypothetical protein